MAATFLKNKVCTGIYLIMDVVTNEIFLNEYAAMYRNFSKTPLTHYWSRILEEIN